jgi:hypothetical protein
VEQHSANVSKTFCQTSQSNGDHVCPCLVTDTKVELSDEGKTEETREKGISHEVRSVTVDGVLNRA